MFKNKGLMRRTGRSGSLFNDSLQDIMHNFESLENMILDTFDSEDNTFLVPTRLFKSQSSLPKINFSETEEAFILEAAVSGFDKEDINLEMKDNMLLVKLNKKEEKEDKNEKKYHVKEISSRSFIRSIPLPSEVDVDNISSELKDGMLHCTLPKKKVEEKSDSIKIEIK